MTTTDAKVLNFRWRSQEQAVSGMQAPLIVVEAPAGAVAQASVGKPLLGQTLSVDGAYVCLIPIGGLASTLKVNVLPQLTTATLSSSGPDALVLFDPRTVNVADAAVLAAGSGDGSLSDNVLQTASLSVNGAVYARYTLTVGSAGTVTFDVAECVGL